MTYTVSRVSRRDIETFPMNLRYKHISARTVHLQSPRLWFWRTDNCFPQTIHWTVGSGESNAISARESKRFFLTTPRRSGG